MCNASCKFVNEYFCSENLLSYNFVVVSFTEFDGANKKSFMSD